MQPAAVGLLSAMRRGRAAAQRHRPGKSECKIYVRRRHPAQSKSLLMKINIVPFHLINPSYTHPPNAFLSCSSRLEQINAMANRAAGKGYENENFYENIKFQFCGIEVFLVTDDSFSLTMSPNESF